MKVLTILGARPQFIKAGSVSREIKKHNHINEIIVHTGQHYDANMSDIFFEEMMIPRPNYFLGIGGKTHGAMTGQMIEKIEEVALSEKPDCILVYGDTNSTLAGAIVASKLHIKLAHIEAGLRSFNMKMPEEINRILTDRVSDILFCPTDIAVSNLNSEGFGSFSCTVVNSGDVMYDGAMFYKNFAKRPAFGISANFVLCTIHRAENTDDKNRLVSILEAIKDIATSKQVILPLHPRTRKIIHELNLNTDGLTIVDPVGYMEMIWLIDNCDLVMTDSGGLQKEAYFFEKPCITLRDETEWVELISQGANILVGADRKKILDVYGKGFDKIVSSNIYGNGNSSTIIVETITQLLD